MNKKMLLGLFLILFQAFLVWGVGCGGFFLSIIFGVIHQSYLAAPFAVVCLVTAFVGARLLDDPIEKHWRLE